MNKIYVGNLPFKTNEQELEELFHQFGEIEDIILIRDRDTKRLKGFGFVTFTTAEAADQALSLDGKEFQGRPLRINIAKERTEGSKPAGGRRR